MNVKLFTKHTSQEHADSISAYLPGGRIFEAARIASTNTHQLLEGFAGELIRSEQLLIDYIDQYDIRTTLDLLLEWEGAVGIPDDCFPGPAESDLNTRRLHILTKLASAGLQSNADFVTLADVLGFPGTVVTTGIAEGIPGIEGRFTIVIKFAFAENKFPIKFPIVFGTDQFSILQCLYQELKPANCKLIFGFL